MIRNYLLIAYRNLLRNKVFSIINIIGLSIGLAATILLSLYIIHELSFDNFHSKEDRIYRVHFNPERDGKISECAITTAEIGVSAIEELPEIEAMMRFSYPHNGFFNYKEKNFNANNVTYIDSSLFTIFDFNLIKGDPEKVLSEPYTVVLTESLAQRIFGKENPLGEVIKLNNEDDLIVTGIIEDFPSNSHMQFEALISFTTLYNMQNVYLGWNGGMNYYTYVLLKDGASIESLEDRFPDFLEEHINYLYRDYGIIMHLDLCKIQDIHLKNNAEADIETKGNITNIIIYSTIALFILIIACINFMNLSTARAMKRYKEVGIRKVVGAHRSQLIRQFLGESIFISLISLILAMIFIEIFQNDFNTLIGKTLNLYSPENIWVLLSLIGMSILVGIISGSYPAFYISNFNPSEVVKGSFTSKKGKSIIRNILVIIQFTVSASLIICTLVIYSQLDYIKNKKLGYNPENILLVPFESDHSREKGEFLIQEIEQIPGVIKVSASSDIPGRGITQNGYVPEGFTDSHMFKALFADTEYLDLLEIPVILGRLYEKGSENDIDAYLINETLAKSLGWDDPIGKTISRNGKHKIIGVVKDFHYSPLHHKIDPMIISMRTPSHYNYISIKYNAENAPEIKKKIEHIWNKFVPQEVFSPFYQDAYISNAYKEESHFARVFTNFSVLAILIACLGLFGLVAYSTEQRKKEIGIRKVMGASFSRILIFLSVDFTKWIILANILAIPLSYYFMKRWLENFAFATTIHLWIYISSILILMILSWLTILFLTARLAGSDPVKALQYE